MLKASRSSRRTPSNQIQNKGAQGLEGLPCLRPTEKLPESCEKGWGPGCEEQKQDRLVPMRGMMSLRPCFRNPRNVSFKSGQDYSQQLFGHHKTEHVAMMQLGGFPKLALWPLCEGPSNGSLPHGYQGAPSFIERAPSEISRHESHRTHSALAPPKPSLQTQNPLATQYPSKEHDNCSPNM